jgi:thymidylate synthase (FAD)
MDNMTVETVKINARTVADVDLEEVMGDDLAIVNAARVSLGKRSKWRYRCNACQLEDIPEMNIATIARGPAQGKVAIGQCFADQGLPFHVETNVTRHLSDADIGLINYLMRKKHGTPFEMVQLRFRISAPIRVMREWQRHRIGSFNEVSTRYVEMQPDFFVPSDGDVRIQEGKPGHYIMRDAPELAEQIKSTMLAAYELAWSKYETLLAMGAAKELAAYVLPMGLYSEQIWSVNLRSLFNFVALRNHTEALREIRRAAEVVESTATANIPHAFAAFEKNGRVVP